jgi:hypothetical protein
MKDESRATKTAVVVGSVTNDVRLFDVPKLTVNIFNFLFNIYLKREMRNQNDELLVADMGLNILCNQPNKLI